MKKFISFVMAAAMVASLVPATAFAAGDVEATAKVIDALDLTKVQATGGLINEDALRPTKDKVPELRLDITRASYRETDTKVPSVDVTLALDNATFLTPTGTSDSAIRSDLKALVSVYDDDGRENKGQGAPATPGTATQFTASPTGTVAAKTGTGNGEIVSSDIVVDSADIPATTTGIDALKALAHATNGPKTLATSDPAPNNVVVKKVSDNTEYTVVASGAATFIPGTSGLADEAALLAALADESFTIVSGGASLTVNGFDLDNDYANVEATKEEMFKYFIAKDNLVRGNVTAATPGTAAGLGVDVLVKEYSLDRSGNVEEVTYTFEGKFGRDWFVIFDLNSKMDKTGEGKQAFVSVESDIVNADDLVYVTVKKRGITASTRKTVNVAEEEKIKLESDLKIKSTVGDFPSGQWFELKLSRGFEYATLQDKAGEYEFEGKDGGTVYMHYLGATGDEITIDNEDIEIEADSAKSGATCTLTVKALDKQWNDSAKELQSYALAGVFNATATVEIAKVVDYKVVLSVDEDEDVPVIYSGVNVDNYGITDDSDHLSLEVTAEETFPGAWSMRKGFNFELPEHVYVTDVQVMDTDNFYIGGDDKNVEVEEVEGAFWNAYQEGSHVNFEFVKRVFDDVDNGLRDQEVATMTFQLELVADPGFEGDVVLKLTGELVDDQEVTIAKFVKPYEVKAEQNDIIIDYRYTDIPTAITITEAEAGLWAKNEARFTFFLERGDKNFMDFEDDPTFEIDSKSGLEIKNDGATDGDIHFTVKTESDDPATVTMKDIRLFMNRSIPAGPYDLSIGSSLADKYEQEVLYAPDQAGAVTMGHDGSTVVPEMSNLKTGAAYNGENAWNSDGDRVTTGGIAKEDSFVGDVCDYSDTVKEAFVNVITAGRDVDDASFTTKVVVPVGESYMVAGEKQIDLDVPAYINAAGYTMLPIRAVATALGISNNNVLWDQPTHTVTILYGQRIITMTQGQKVVYVNGSAIPASAAVENTNSRTFLPMRDLATALGVTDISWDQATRTATLNGNQK